jgi:hypothetical protein
MVRFAVFFLTAIHQQLLILAAIGVLPVINSLSEQPDPISHFGR